MKTWNQIVLAPGHRLRKCRILPKIADLLDFDLFRFLTSPGGYFQARGFLFGSNGLYWSPEHTREWRRLYFDITHLSEQPIVSKKLERKVPTCAGWVSASAKWFSSSCENTSAGSTLCVSQNLPVFSLQNVFQTIHIHVILEQIDAAAFFNVHFIPDQLVHIFVST